MTCREFLTLWNDRLDGSIPANLAELDAHAVDCADCAGRAAGFRLMESRFPAPEPSLGLTDRVLDRWNLELAASRRRRTWAVRGFAASLGAGALAAAAAAMFYLGGGPSAIPEAPHAPQVRPWTSALADATSATIDLARETSAPAARLGQVAIQAATPDEIGWPRTTTSPPSGLLQSISERVNTGVKPLSGSARRAFSFLSGPGGGDSRPIQREPGA